MKPVYLLLFISLVGTACSRNPVSGVEIRNVSGEVHPVRHGYIMFTHAEKTDKVDYHHFLLRCPLSASGIFSLDAIVKGSYYLIFLPYSSNPYSQTAVVSETMLDFDAAVQGKRIYYSFEHADEYADFNTQADTVFTVPKSPPQGISLGPVPLRIDKRSPPGGAILNVSILKLLPIW